MADALPTPLHPDSAAGMNDDERTTEMGPPPVPGNARVRRKMRTTDEWNSAIVHANATAEYPTLDEEETSPGGRLPRPTNVQMEVDLDTPTPTGWIRPPGVLPTTETDDARKQAVTSMHRAVNAEGIFDEGRTSSNELNTAKSQRMNAQDTGSHRVSWVIENLRTLRLEFSDIWIPRKKGSTHVDDGSFAAVLDSLATLADSEWNDSQDSFVVVAFRLNSRQLIYWLRDGELGAALLIIPIAVEAVLLRLVDEAKDKWLSAPSE